nr:hypothetical protein [Tanacetum cinerariifolium]
KVFDESKEGITKTMAEPVLEEYITRMESNKEVTNDNEPSRDKGEDSKEENEIDRIFRIETKIFDYESPVPWVIENPWNLDGVWKEPTAIKHRCKPFCFKSGHSEWPTCNWKDEEYCNGGNLPRKFQVGNTIHYQDYEWYEALEDSDLKDQALRNKAALEESMNQDEDSSDDAWSNYLPIDEWCDQGDATNMKSD